MAYRLILHDTTPAATEIRDFAFDTKKDFCAFICAQIDAKEFTHFVLSFRGMEVHTSNKDSLQGLFQVNTASFTISNGNHGQHPPIQLYRFASEVEYKEFLKEL